MCRDRPGCSHFVLDLMRRQAPVWRESYRTQAGTKRAHWWVDGKRGNRPDCRLKRKRSCKAYVTGSRLGSFSIRLSWSFVAVDRYAFVLAKAARINRAQRRAVLGY